MKQTPPRLLLSEAAALPLEKGKGNSNLVIHGLLRVLPFFKGENDAAQRLEVQAGREGRFWLGCSAGGEEEMFETGGDSHFEDWLASYGIQVDLEDMLARRDRLYLIAFDLSDETGAPSMRVDLWWVWSVLAILLAGIRLLIAG
ncbi:MAG: hypothetical protein JW757_11120 [Anaerolineales bacterium]|nr:hypothetical protein [Anaerolineales bacterium]